jgi:hypothetical protein
MMSTPKGLKPTAVIRKGWTAFFVFTLKIMKNGEKEMLQENKPNDAANDFSNDRAALCGDLIDLIRKRTDELINRGSSPELARFDCLTTLKMIVDDLHGQCDVGHARQEWYREYVLIASKNGSAG